MQEDLVCVQKKEVKLTSIQILVLILNWGVFGSLKVWKMKYVYKMKYGYNTV